PAMTLLPQWLSGYASLLAADLGDGLDLLGAPGQGSSQASSTDPASPRAIVNALPPDQRNLSLRLDSIDALTRLVADRLVVDAREAGLTVRLDPVGTLAPRPDVRLMRVALEATSPERVLESLLKNLGPRITNQLGLGEPPGPRADLETVYRFERSMLE